MPSCFECDRYCSNVGGVCVSCASKSDAKAPAKVSKAWLKNPPSGVSKMTVARWPWLLSQARNEVDKPVWPRLGPMFLFNPNTSQKIGYTFLMRLYDDTIVFVQLQPEPGLIGVTFEEMVAKAQVIVPIAWATKRTAALGSIDWSSQALKDTVSDLIKRQR